MGHDPGRRSGGQRLVVVARIDIAAVFRPVAVHYLLDREAASGEDVEPEQHRPEAILFAHMAGAGAEAFLAAERDLAGIHQVAEELPAGRRLVTGHAEFPGNAVGRRTRRHRARDARQPGRVARRQRGIGGDEGEAVGRIDEEVAAENHVAVAVAVRSGAEVGRVLAVHDRHQLVGIGQVGVRMAAAEIGQGHAVDHRARGRAQPAFENLPGIGSGHRVHGIEAQAKAAADQFAYRGEIEQRFHEFGIVGHRVDDFHAHVAERMAARAVEIDRRRIDDAIARQRAAAGENSVGDLLRRRAAVGGVVLDAEIALGTARVVAGGEDDAAERAVLADHCGCRRRRQDAALPHQHLRDAVGGSHPENDLDRLPVVVAPVAAQHQRAARRRGRIVENAVEHRLDEIFQVVGRPEHGDLLAQARGARLLVRKRRGGDGSDVHLRPPLGLLSFAAACAATPCRPRSTAARRRSTVCSTGALAATSRPRLRAIWLMRAGLSGTPPASMALTTSLPA